MNEALVFFMISLVLFIAGMYLAAPLIGIKIGGYLVPSIRNNITITTITRNKETHTITLPKNAVPQKTTKVEKLEIILTAYAVGSYSQGWDVIIVVKNTGTKTASVDYILINQLPHYQYKSMSKTPISR